MPKKPNVALGLRFLIAYEENGAWPADRDGEKAVQAAKDWIKSLPPFLSLDDLRRSDEEMSEWRNALRASLKRCFSKSGTSGASVVVGHLTEGQRKACLEEMDQVSRFVGVKILAKVKKEGDRITIEMSRPGGRRARSVPAPGRKKDARGLDGDG